MAKKYLLHRITEEDADYLREETYISPNEIRHGNCYLLVNKKNGKIFRENEQILIYKAAGRQGRLPDDTGEEKHRFLEAIEACAFFRGYANEHDIKFKTSKISELLNELEDHEIEVPEGTRRCKIESTSDVQCTQDILAYLQEAADGFEVLNNLQRGLPALALYISERNGVRENRLAQRAGNNAYQYHEFPFEDDEEPDMEDDEEWEEVDLEEEWDVY